VNIIVVHAVIAMNTTNSTNSLRPAWPKEGTFSWGLREEAAMEKVLAITGSLKR
jgi:hypothetical protein